MTGAGRHSFDAAADIYHDARPGYPDALFDRLATLLPTTPDVLEIGPGTGQATGPLLARGASVHAVELGPALAARLVERLAGAVLSNDLTVGVGDVEELAPEAESVDAVVSATAYHWISPDEQLAMPRRWLRPHGRLAIIDTIQVTSKVDGGYYEAVKPIYERYQQARSGPIPTAAAATPPMFGRMSADSACTDVTLDRYRWDQTYSAEAYGRLLSTFSGPLTMPAVERDAMVDELVDLVHTMGGSVTRPLVITLATCQFKPSRY